MSNHIHISQNAEEYLSEVMKCDISAKLVLSHVRRLLDDGWQSESEGLYYFAHESTIASRTVNGIVETPRSMAAYMVSLAYSRWQSDRLNSQREFHTIHWFDPCGGAGIFPVEILKFYFENLNSNTASSLPNITISEISELGLAVSFINIILTLQAFGISPSEYIKTGKLNLILGDTLDRFHEDNNFFSEKNNFDIVIGNPPYVRASRLTTSYKKKLKQKFPRLYCGSADLYTYFIASGISNIDKHGILVYISPATFIRAKSGAPLRDWLLKNASLDTFIDLDETKIFEDADLHTAIYAFSKHQTLSKNIQYQHIKDEKELNSLVGGNISLTPVSVDAQLGSGWAFHASQSSLDEYSRIFSGCVKLQDFGIQIYSGIRPGYSAAFFLNAKQYEKFSPKIRDKWIKPLILPSNIKKWSGHKNINYMIVIPIGTTLVDQEIISFLAPHKEALERRVEVRNKEQWYTLRSCSYYNEMEKQKIAFPDLSAHQRFSLVEQGIYIPDGAYIIDTTNLVLLGILNSNLAKQYFVHRCSSVGNLKSKGRFRFKKEFVKDFPLPRHFLSDGNLQGKISNLVSFIINNGETEETNQELNELVNGLYQEK
ncbi:MAG: Eco57I restriction-modification methylase domain-containing protein [Shewanella sp.]